MKLLKKRYDKAKTIFILRYQIIVLLPIILAGLLIFKRFETIMFNEIVDSDVKSTNAIVSNVDSQIRSMQGVATSIMDNDFLNPYYLNDGVYSKIQAIMQLQNYNSANEFFNEIFYYVKGNDYILSSNTSYSLNEKINGNLFEYFDMNKNDLFNDMNLDNLAVKCYGDKLFFYFPKVNRVNNNRVIIFIVDKERFKNLVMAGKQTNETISKIMFEDSEIMNINGDRIQFQKILPNSTPLLDKYLTMQVNRREYIVITDKSEISQLKYYKFIPKEEILLDIEAEKKNFLLVGFGIVGIIFLAITLISRISYKPIGKIMGYTETNTSNMGDINLAVDTFFTNKKALEDKNAYYHDEFKRKFFNDIILGNVKDYDEYTRQSKNIGINTNLHKFNVLIIKQRDAIKLDKNDFNLYINQIIAYLNGIEDCIAFEISENTTGYRIILVNYEEHDCFNLAQMLTLFSKESCYNEYILIISRTISDVALIGNELFAMIQYFEQDNTYESGIIQVPWNMKTRILQNWNSKQFEKKVEQAFYEKDIENVKKIVLEACNSIAIKNSLVYYQYLRFDLINTILKTCVKYKINAFQNDFEPIKLVNTLASSEQQNFEEIIEKIIELISSDRYFIKNEGNEMIETTINYVEKNYSNPQFTIQKMSEDINYSYKYLSRQFKNIKGCNLSDYLHRKRIEKFKEMIKTSHENIDELIRGVGYEDINTFNRRFKQFEGVTYKQYKASLNNDSNQSK